MAIFTDNLSDTLIESFLELISIEDYDLEKGILLEETLEYEGDVVVDEALIVYEVLNPLNEDEDLLLGYIIIFSNLDVFLEVLEDEDDEVLRTIV